MAILVLFTMSSIPSSCIFIKLYRTVVCIEIKFPGKKSQLDISRATEAVAWRCSVKKVFVKVSQNSEKNTCARVSFSIKLQVRPGNLKKALAQVFSCEFCETFWNIFFYRTLPVAASWANIIGLFWPNELLARKATWETHIGLFSAWISTVNNTGH